MVSSAPTTPVPRRSASLPVPRPSGLDPQVEILFTLPSARIIEFQTSGSVSRRGSSSGDNQVVEEEPGTLPWVSRFERTIAVGPFRIYRAPGSVAFLNCQKALKPILPKSQCWAVDDASSKFVLQIRPPHYWRIEIPNETPEEKVRAEELKDVLGKILQFEKTSCPFQRSFVVELPETPKTPIKKKPWKPVERSRVEPLPGDNNLEEEQDAPSVSSTKRSSTPSPHLEVAPVPDPIRGSSQDPVTLPTPLAKESVIEIKQKLFNSETSSPSPNELESESLEYQVITVPSTTVHTVSDTAKPSSVLETSLLEEDSVFADFTGLEEDDSYSDATDDTNITPRNKFQPHYQSTTFEPERETRTQSLQHCSRSITAPPVLSLVTSPPSKYRTASPLRISSIEESNSDFSSSVDSFHSVQSWHSPLAPPSPPSSGPSSPIKTYPYPHNNIALPKRPTHHTRDVSELTITPETPREWDMNHASDPESVPRSRSLSATPKTPTLVNDRSVESDDEQIEVVTPSFTTTQPTIRHRATTSSNSRRRALSPLPAAVNIFSPPRRRTRRLQTARHLPIAIIQKTCEILLSPPSHLLRLMLDVASKIAAGEWRGVLGDNGDGDAVHWDFEDEYAGEGWTEDDYGVALPIGRGKTKDRNVPGESWEVD